MNDMISFQAMFDQEIIQILLLLASLAFIFIIVMINNHQTEKVNKKIKNDLSEIKKHLEVQSTFLSQFNDHFGLLDRKLKSLEEITSITSRDISSMAEGITGEVGVGKAIELARRGASVDEILENANIRQDQAELIVKFHGEKN